MQHREVLGTLTMDKSAANEAAFVQLKVERDILMRIQLVKLLNDIVEQDHRAV